MKTLSFVAAIVLVSGSLGLAHHSFAAHYFEEQSVTVEGTLTEFQYSAPHAWVYFTAAGQSGASQQYSAEWANPNRLARDGVTKDTLKAGDQVVITGSPGRNPGENRIHLKRIERPADGWNWGRRR